jgi:glycine/D-amino acid oxidase-like deaminating enzyme
MPRRAITTMMSQTMKTPPKNIVVIGGGIQGTSVAYFLHSHLSSSSSSSTNTKIKILEAREPASAASGKGGGFMARSWGDGSPTQALHHLGYDLYAQLAQELNIESYRTLPVLSVSPGNNSQGFKVASKDNNVKPLMPNWLNGNFGRVSVMGYGDDTAQVTPKEVVEKMIEKSGIEVVLGECVGIQTEDNDKDDSSLKTVQGVKYIPRGEDYEALLDADVVVVSAGPWSCAAEDWFDGAVDLPMEGVKSTSIVWKKGEDDVDGTALFCGEDNRFGTHRKFIHDPWIFVHFCKYSNLILSCYFIINCTVEVYPRPDGSIYICGIGGSDYISKDDLKEGAFREECNAKELRVEAASGAFREMSSLYNSKGSLEKVQACMRPCPPDAMPYMGKIPGFQGCYINAGHNCWGIAWSPACGQAMAELILDGESTSVNLRPFDPSRFTTKVGGGRGRKRRGESVGEQW